MPDLRLRAAQKILTTALKTAREKELKPVAVAVYDMRGALKAFGAEDGTSLRRGEIAMGKAYGALALGMGSRAIATRAVEQGYFVAAVTHAVGGSLVPVPGGVLIHDRNGGLAARSASQATPPTMTRSAPWRASRRRALPPTRVKAVLVRRALLLNAGQRQILWVAAARLGANQRMLACWR